MFEKTYASTNPQLVELEIGKNYAGLMGYDESQFKITFQGNGKWHMIKAGAEQTITDEALTQRMLGYLRKANGQSL